MCDESYSMRPDASFALRWTTLRISGSNVGFNIYPGACSAITLHTQSDGVYEYTHQVAWVEERAVRMRVHTPGGLGQGTSGEDESTHTRWLGSRNER